MDSSPYPSASRWKTFAAAMASDVKNVNANVLTQNTSTSTAMMSGRPRTYRSPARSCPFFDVVTGVRCSSAGFIRISPKITASVETALTRNTQPVPVPMIIKPAMAGPTIRARLNVDEFSATALARCSRPTISPTKLCRTGGSNAVNTPNTRHSR